MARHVLSAAAFLCGATMVAVWQPVPAAQRSAPSTVTYYRDVAPVLQKNCEPSKPRCSRRRCRRGSPTAATDTF
jgi:hypothetical protein